MAFLLYLRWDDVSAHANAVLVRRDSVQRFDPGRWTPDGGCRADTHAMELADRLWPVREERRMDRSACLRRASWLAAGSELGPQTLQGSPADRYCVGWATLFAATAALNPDLARGSEVLEACLPDLGAPVDHAAQTVAIDAAGLRRLQVRATQRVAAWVRHCEDQGWVY